MKKRFTFLFALLALVFVSTSAQYTTDGLYTIECVGTAKYMSNPGSVGSTLPMTTPADGTTEFYIIENTVTTGMYNIITKDELYLAATDGSKGLLIENTEANRNSATGGALVDLIDEGANPYRFQADFGGTVKAWNGQKDSKTMVGMGTTASANYQWNLVRIGDLAAPAPSISITEPIEGDDILPGATVTLKATATAEDGQTLASVEFLVDDVKVGDGVLNVDVYEYTWTAPATEATYVITAKATSTAPASTISDPVSVVVAVNPAAVSLTWPSDAATVLPNQQFTLKAEATPETGNTISKVEFYEGANLLGEGTLSGDVYQLDHYFSTEGTFSITAKVTDSGSKTATTAAVNIETSLTTSVKSFYLNFESAYTSGDWVWKSSKYAGAGLSYVSYDVAKARSAANGVLEVDFSTAIADGADNLEYQVEGLDALPSAGNVYISIHYADDNSAEAPAAGPTLWSSALRPTPGSAAANDDGTFAIKSWSKPASDMGADGSSVTIYPALRIDANSTAGKMYFDDVVMYYDPNASGNDATAPTAPTNLEIPTVEVSNIVLTWNEGIDVGIGIDSTYILRANAGEAVPVLTNYVGYSDKGLPAGLSSVGNWTVLGAVPLGTKTFTDVSLTTEEEVSINYTYAVVHKDYAYNYSPSVTANTGVVTGIKSAGVAKFNCYGISGAIQLSELPVGDNLEVYGLSGMKVVSKVISTTNLSVNLPKGIYMVRVAGAVRKVAVR